MDSATYLRHLRRELDAFRRCLDGDLAVPIEHCGDWTLLDLADHLGRDNIWAVAAVVERRGDYESVPAPRERAALVPWFEKGASVLLDVLDTDPATGAWTFHPPHTVGFWQRRRALETLVHRWDAERALGIPGPLDLELVADGIAEVFDTMAPRMIARDRARYPDSALRLVATDTGGSWTYGPGAPVVTLFGPAEDLFLLLWGRLPRDSAGFTWEGDQRAGELILDGPLTP
ncbi:maleylpyruvate isomerase family mycothiol-dependent enzyme [Streptomyces hainanensis]|uniref:Maleylpyruvate isomerase family mycothiol-dependent enzyme n=1 Tax=Streptomyces hainanensis TaxID=402648 RepID=A0A4R4T5J4_9ACTN|nr:maleylpyruvate isomerase family mycothiol-dependent enzyme [Streptomyces hainanensis]TDC70604.1 maleylpyruvate isomerase family mycothiol-dependent enzyme [Streptomyces hainanensis]